jgi:hypothetical protein
VQLNPVVLLKQTNKQLRENKSINKSFSQAFFNDNTHFSRSKIQKKGIFSPFFCKNDLYPREVAFTI